jgi:hypothetical protein
MSVHRAFFYRGRGKGIPSRFEVHLIHDVPRSGVIHQKDPVVEVQYEDHPIHGKITARIRKSKIKYGGY